MKQVSVAELVALPVVERLRLVEAIWDSIAEVPEQIELTSEQASELDCRFAAYNHDPTAGSPWSEVHARIVRPEAENDLSEQYGWYEAQNSD